jgi:hypothetical protein
MPIRLLPAALSFAFLALPPNPGHARAEVGSTPKNPAVALTGKQLDAFAELTGDPKPLVLQRLFADPGLVPYAAAAADTRRARQSTGKAMTITGFTILGVGAVVGVGMEVVAFLEFFGRGICAGADNGSGDACPGPPPDYGQLALEGLAVIAVGVAIGCAIGIPGIVRMNRQSEAEKEAVDHYLTSSPPVSLPSPSSHLQSPQQHVPLRSIGAPILSFRF